MSLVTEIIDGMVGAIGQMLSTDGYDQAGADNLARELESAHAALLGYLKEYQTSSDAAAASLAQFLSGCERIATQIGGSMDKSTRRTLKSVLAQARLLDANLETSLAMYKPGLVRALVLGNPIRSLFVPQLAASRVAKRAAKLTACAARLRAADGH